MKKMLLVLFLPVVCFAQDENQRNFHFELNTSINSTLSFMQGYKSMLGFGVGALVEFRKSKPFRISTGIEFNQTNQGLNQDYSIGKNEPTLTSRMAKLQFISLPINFNRYIGSSQRLLLSGGLIIDYMLKTDQSVFNVLGEESHVNLDHRVINVAPTFGLGWVFPTNKVSFVLKSDVRLGIFPLFDGGSSGKYGWNQYARLLVGMKF